MNTLAQKIYDLVTADVVLAPLIDNRFYPTLGKQGGTYPMVVWQEIVSIAEHTHDNTQGLDRTDIQFSCYATDAMEAYAVRKALRDCLTATDAMVGVKVILPVQRTFHEDSVQKHNAQLDLTFWHNPSA